MRYTFIALFFFSVQILFGQSNFDFKDKKVDDLSDAQIQTLLERAKARGYSEQDIYSLAQAQGYPSSEINKLKTRISAISGESKPTEKVKAKPIPPSKDQILRKGEVLPDSDRHFGYELFTRNSQLNLEPNLLIPVPKDYIIGSNDEISIFIYGESEKIQIERVKSNGQLYIQNVGLVPVSGLTMEEATKRIKSRMSQVYSDLLSTSPSTFIQVYVTEVRTIKVNMVGELVNPGSYTFSGLSTVFNALYAAGGPNRIGTLRNIEVLRKNKKIAEVDFYDFLMKGETKGNVRLENDDVILVKSYQNRTEIKGEIKRPGLFELKVDETFSDLLQYAGGFTESAYQERIGVVRNGTKNKSVFDLHNDQFEIFETKTGDVYTVGKILSTYKNRITISGAVMRPGDYALTDGMTLGDLISKADGLQKYAFMERAVITRTKENFETEIHSISLLDDSQSDFLLRREDNVSVLSIFDVSEESYVKISGEVIKGGVYPFSDNMTVEDLIFKANGFTEAAAHENIEIARRISEASPDNMTELISVSISRDLKVTSGEQTLIQPYDHVIVRRNPNYFREITVKIIGEVMFPGKYVLLSENERISEVLKRAGGLDSQAYIDGATLVRNTEFFISQEEVISRQEDLIDFLNKVDPENLSEADELRIEEIYDDLQNDYLYPALNNEDDVAINAKRERLIELAERNPSLDGIDIKRSESIAIKLSSVLKSPGGTEDLILQDGDIINVPKELRTIRMRGGVLYPNTVRFERSKSLDYFIGKAGGFATRAKKKNTFLVYANGDVSRTKSFLGIRKYPKPEPGSEIIVPMKLPKVQLQPGEIVGLTSGLATLALIVTQIIQVSK